MRYEYSKLWYAFSMSLLDLFSKFLKWVVRHPADWKWLSWFRNKDVRISWTEDQWEDITGKYVDSIGPSWVLNFTIKDWKKEYRLKYDLVKKRWSLYRIWNPEPIKTFSYSHNEFRKKLLSFIKKRNEKRH